MTLESVAFIESTSDIVSTSGMPKQLSKGDFAEWFESQFEVLNSSIKSSDKLVRDLVVGESSNLHHVMIELEKTKITFQLAMQVRNRLLEGYQEIMRMQV